MENLRNNKLRDLTVCCSDPFLKKGYGLNFRISALGFLVASTSYAWRIDDKQRETN